jgi:PAS domain S-box-containing protein
MSTLNIILFTVLVASLAMLIRMNIISRKMGQMLKQEVEQLKTGNLILKVENEKLQKESNESELLARIVRQSPNAIMLMDKEGNIQWINKGFKDMYEYSFHEFTSALGSNYRQTSFSPDVQYRLDTIEASKQPFRYEALNITRTGKQLWTQTALVPVLDDSGEISHLITIDADIHNRVAQSDLLVIEMERLNDKIDQMAEQNEKLNSNFSSLFMVINELYKLIDQTDSILKFIKNISDETRILGINASIEAARAGEHGQGFRVITNTIIDISDKTIKSISEINAILQSINKKQDELIVKKDDSEKRMQHYQLMVDQIKLDVMGIEKAIALFKSLA